MTHDDLRYPIGPFTPPGAMSDDDRTAAVNAIAQTPAAMRQAVMGLGDERLDTPYRPEGWTVRQVVHHVADSHLNAYVRMKLTVTEHEPRIMTYDQDQWASLADMFGPIETSLTLLDALHTRWATFLRSLPNEAWQRRLDHPEIGHMPLETLLALYAWHGAHHVAHITGLREREGWETSS